MAKYVKLGDKAESFYDPFSKFSIVRKEVKELVGNSLKSNRVKSAIKGGHLVYASQVEFEKVNSKTPVETKDNTAAGSDTKTGNEGNTSTGGSEETIESKFGNNADELVQYYIDTFDVKKKDIEKFKELSLQGMVDELTKLEE
jgi:hypothetical protein